MIMKYNEADVIATLSLYRETKGIKIESEIDKIRRKMDVCDDIQMRARLAKKIRRLQVKLNTL